MKKILLMSLSLMVVAFLLTACQPTTNTAPNVTIEGAVITSGNVTTQVDSEEIDVNSANVTVTEKGETVDIKNASHTITGTEGDLIKLELKAVDPDGDKILYTYSEPFNKNGLWQTKDGDAGKYLVTITASDGKLTSNIDVLVIVNPSNKAPIIDCMDDLVIKEGDTVELKCNFFDKENDPLVIEYSGWMTSTSYTTNFESSGNHKVFVRVTDGFHNVTKTINIEVQNVDRAPIFEKKLKDLNVVETDVVTLAPEIMDPDGDSITLTYSEPFDSNGVWKTKIDDAGTYPVTVVASDGELTTKTSFTLTVGMLNTAPVMKLIPDITVNEGETVTLKADVVDREKDPIIVKFTGWMKSDKYTTTYDDAYTSGCDEPGCSETYKVTVTASDGVYDAVQDVYITVVDQNRPPEFVWP
jgi:hypothetical protein